MNPKVSVIIPIYNDCRFLHETIKSVLLQTFKDFEIIVVDDCSLNSENILKIVKDLNENIKYIRNKSNLGLAASRNVGINNSKGEYLVFLDADDVIYNNKLKNQIEFLEKNEVYDMVFSDENLILNNIINYQPCHNFNYELFQDNKFILFSFVENSFISVFTVTIRRRSLDKFGKFNPSLKWNEDDDLWFRFLLNGKVKCLQYISGARRIHDLNMSRNRFKMNYFQIKTIYLWMIYLLKKRDNSLNIKLIKKSRNTLISQFLLCKKEKKIDILSVFYWLLSEFLFFIQNPFHYLKR